jgi:hypothetical protein
MPAPPRAQIDDLISEYLGGTRRAGTTTLPEGTPSGEEEVMVAAGFSGPLRVMVAGRLHERSDDQIVASVFSLSRAAPHLFGARLGEFEADVRELLARASPAGRFAERSQAIELVIWGTENAPGSAS